MPPSSFAPTALQARGAHLALPESTWVQLSAWLVMLHDMSAHANLIGTRDPDRMVEEILLDSLDALPLLPDTGHVLDVGSGAGVPGLPLAIARPDLHFTLLEPRQRRAAFLRHCRRALNLSPLTIEEARLESWVAKSEPKTLPDMALARAVFSPSDWLQMARFLPEGRRVLVFTNGHAAHAWASLAHHADTWTLEASLDSPLHPHEPRSILRLRRTLPHPCVHQ